MVGSPRGRPPPCRHGAVLTPPAPITARRTAVLPRAQPPAQHISSRKHKPKQTPAAEERTASGVCCFIREIRNGEAAPRHRRRGSRGSAVGRSPKGSRKRESPGHPPQRGVAVTGQGPVTPLQNKFCRMPGSYPESRDKKSPRPNPNEGIGLYRRRAVIPRRKPPPPHRDRHRCRWSRR